MWLCAQRRLRSAWASAQTDQSSLSAYRSIRFLATHWAHSEDSDQTGRMPRLIWVFAGRTFILFVLSCRGSNVFARPLACTSFLISPRSSELLTFRHRKPCVLLSYLWMCQTRRKSQQINLPHISHSHLVLHDQVGNEFPRLKHSQTQCSICVLVRLRFEDTHRSLQIPHHHQKMTRKQHISFWWCNIHTYQSLACETAINTEYPWGVSGLALEESKIHTFSRI